VDRARPGHHQQPVVGTVEHRTDLRAGSLYRLRMSVAQRQLVDERGRREQRLIADDPGIGDA